MRLRDYLKLAISIMVCLLAGAFSSIATRPAVSGWYSTIKKPFFNPPNWVFGPVWTTLYILMGVALFLVWNYGSKKKNLNGAINIFMAQLILNVTWSFAFFGLRSPALGLLVIMGMIVAIVYTIIEFYKIHKCAAYLLFPYLVWTTFAALLNIVLLLMNV